LLKPCAEDVKTLKDTELRLISELMKDSRRSDRELAKVIGASQPTITRTRRKLEKEGYIKEYTMIPDFAKLGYELMSVLFVKVKDRAKPEDFKRASEATAEEVNKNVFPDLLNEAGMGLGFDGIIITLHRSYSDYTKQLNYARSRSFIQSERVDGFLVNLKDPVHFRSLTLSVVANDLINKNKEEIKPS
jgi:DNA-binding Lrp family transcriptional regulator